MQEDEKSHIQNGQNVNDSMDTYTKIQQSLEQSSLSSCQNGDQGHDNNQTTTKVTKVANVEMIENRYKKNDIILVNNEESWWVAPFKSYYSQLFWGKLCSYFQPTLGNHFNGSEIIPGVWISDHASVCDLQALCDRGIKHVMCAVLGVKPLFPRDLQYTCYPIRDTNDQDIYHFFNQATEVIHKCVTAKEPIIIHCRCGVSRSVTLFCAYLIRYHGLDHNEAIQKVQSKRACANPINSFRNQLRSYCIHF